MGVAMLTEEEARQLVVSSEQSFSSGIHPLLTAIREAKIYNAEAKRKKIEELEAELKKLKGSL
jgi:hypothetical protein